MNANNSRKRFKFKQFELTHHNSTMKVGTDGVLLGSWVEVHENKNILDVGTGCGLIALMAAQRNSNGIIDAIDIDGPSIEEAKSNLDASPWKTRLNAIQTSLQDFEPEKKYDHILSNPPFFESGTISPVSERHKARHTVTLPINELITHTYRLLTNNGRLSVIIPCNLEPQLANYGEEKGFFLIRKTLFYSKKGNKPERSLLCLSKIEQNLEPNNLVHYNDDGTWTEGYKNLTKDYHIKL
ncbi:tRNA1(Val) (adenine(37)-N6)-methyltransferase [Fulvivirga lutimaris]|uniref:tRNA1(Val) (adenine(37)-N6)-methyltransferase n=1 Tax=Fulvivirga lutimaris TaxID=1819566 RepID=UPI0012BB8692|nr:methyltransferase [Fulvivirga lutimaris]MTI39641.1 methyltransferase domain-containing protein [Fulvivirga lutimaris]